MKLSYSTQSSFSYAGPTGSTFPDSPLSKWFLIPQRRIFCILGALVCLFAYALRSIHIVTTIPIYLKYNKTINNTCPLVGQFANYEGSVYEYRLQQTWELIERNLVISSYYWGYVLTMVPGGYLADKYGGKYVVAFGIFGTSVTAFIYPAVLKISTDRVNAMLALQFTNGFFQGGVLPAITSMVAKWIPTSERTTAFCFVYGSISLGTFSVKILGTELMRVTKLWQPVFYFFGSAGLLMVVSWIIFGFSSPQTNPFMRGAEKALLFDDLGYVEKADIVVPWKKMLKSTALWALIIADIGECSAWVIIFHNLPFYLDVVLKFSMMYDTNWAATPYLFCWIMAMCSACISDWLINEKHVSTTIVRKVFTTISLFGTAATLLFAAFAKCEAISAIIYFSMAVAFTGSYIAGATVSVIDLTPNFAGSFIGVMGVARHITSLLSPFILTAIAPNNSLEQWQRIFWTTFFILTGTSLIYAVLGTATEQAWNRVR